MVTLTAIVTDPNGIDDVIGGMLIDGRSGRTLGAFATSAAEGAYGLEVSFVDFLMQGGADTGAAPERRTVRARFFDASGHTAEAELVVELGCNPDALLCGGDCVRRDETHCGACADVCMPGGSCVDGRCFSEADLAPSIEAFSVRVVSPTSPAGYGDFLDLEVSFAGRHTPGAVMSWSVVAENPRDARLLEEGSHVTADATGHFAFVGTFRAEELGLSAFLGTHDATLRISDSDGLVSASRATTFEIPACPGTDRFLSCRADGACESALDPAHCTSCGEVCGGSVTVTPQLFGASPVSLSSYCEPTGCAVTVTANHDTCTTACSSNGMTCTRVRGSSFPCSAYVSALTECICDLR